MSQTSHVPELPAESLDIRFAFDLVQRTKDWQEYLENIPGVFSVLNQFDGHIMDANDLLEVCFLAIVPEVEDRCYQGIAVFQRNDQALIYIREGTCGDTSLDFSSAPVDYQEQKGTWQEILFKMFEHIVWARGGLPEIPKLDEEGEYYHDYEFFLNMKGKFEDWDEYLDSVVGNNGIVTFSDFESSGLLFFRKLDLLPPTEDIVYSLDCSFYIGDVAEVVVFSEYSDMNERFPDAPLLVGILFRGTWKEVCDKVQEHKQWVENSLIPSFSGMSIDRIDDELLDGLEFSSDDDEDDFLRD